MEADDRQTPSVGERVDRGAERPLELSELIVDMHPQCLERAGGRMLPRLACPHGAGDQLRELSRALDRMLAPPLDDRLRDAARKPFFSERGDHLANLVDARTSEPRGDRLTACRVHAHIERTVGPEAEAARRIVELRRGDTEVEQNTPAIAAARVCWHQ